MYISDLITVIGYLHTAGFKNHRGINGAKCMYLTLVCCWLLSSDPTGLNLWALWVVYCIIFVDMTKQPSWESEGGLMQLGENDSVPFFWCCSLSVFDIGTTILIQHKYFSLQICCKLLYSDCLRQESNFLASMRPGHCLVRACLLHCMRVRLHNGYTQAYVEIMQHMHTHKAVTGHVEGKKVTLLSKQSN